MSQHNQKKIETIERLTKLKESWKDLPYYNEERFQLGYRIVKRLVDDWNDDENPPKVYIKGRRVHHGAVGVGMAILGLLAQLSGDSIGLGYAYALIEDDVGDAEEWFDFEKGGEFTKWISTV